MAQALPAAAASAWKTGVSGAGPKWAAKVAACTVNPMALAATALQEKGAANYAAAIPGMVASLNAYPVGSWKAACGTPAAQSNYTNGASKGLAAYTAAVTKQAATLWPGQAAASAAAGGGQAGMDAAYQFVQQAKANGQTK